MYVVSNRVVSFGIKLETHMWVVFVPVGWHMWLGWAGCCGDANVVHIFREWWHSMVSGGVLFAEGLPHMGNRLPVGGAVLISKGFAGRYKALVTNDEGLHTYDVGMVFWLVKGTCCIIFCYV